jgi:hypothetical protein
MDGRPAAERELVSLRQAFVLVGFVVLAIVTTANRAIRGAPSFDEVTSTAS